MPKIPLKRGIPDKYEFQKWMGQYPRECVRWLPPEEQELERAYKDGVSVTELARRHGRRERGITSRLSKLLGQAFIEEYIFNNKQPQAKENKMNQNELYIQYLEDALNHAKTGEPMKCWQWRYREEIDRDFNGSWGMMGECTFIVPDEIDIRIKPEPYKWTAFAYTSCYGNTTTGTLGGHVKKENILIPIGSSNLTVHHHEIEIE